MTEQEPAWTQDGALLKTHYRGYLCWVNPSAIDTPRWGIRRPGTWQNEKHGVGDSVDTATIRALRAVRRLTTQLDT